MMYLPTTENYPPVVYRTVTHNRPRLRLDRSYLVTKLGVLKLVELISFAIASIIYSTCAMFKYIHIFINFVNLNGEPIHPKSKLETAIQFGYNFHRIAIFLLSLSVILLICSYLFHIVERYHTIPWYIIEFVLCVAFISITTAAGGIAIRIYTMQVHNADTEFIFSALFSFIASLACLYHLYLLHQRWTQKIPPQTSEP